MKELGAPMAASRMMRRRSAGQSLLVRLCEGVRAVWNDMVDILGAKSNYTGKLTSSDGFPGNQTHLVSMICHLTVFGVLGVSPAFAASVDRCDAAARHAAWNADVPENVLRAIARVETGRWVDGKLQAWPWTVNMEGKGYWFESKETAHAFVRAEYSRGARNFDIGCFQINHRWHGAAFDSLEVMFDPMENALYAAGFLQDLQSEMGSWSKAVGAYHSRLPQRAQAYRERFEDVHAGLQALSAPTTHENARSKRAESVQSGNSYPLMQRVNGIPRAGSLVPMDNVRRYVIRLDQTLRGGF
ncbi:MAG: transglycosylase SLT domain-containing protein [Roseovarius sp.]